MRAQYPLHSFNILLLLESREYLEVVSRSDQSPET